eukprot:CAMPEP_0113960536 /NCGR_PEP_ID=MMETSP0011_2-20120614/4767_1 /TAXON_ID=101924 /ORGANISM="Rhodosorus marinus" /LENGTH=66 /DNA_ID=CAMNT_0000971995 /DNA_START=549 /DNA_END=746 /DNA_ORIENTATION=+ /assembly_acc=CAM_ASM_000156
MTHPPQQYPSTFCRPVHILSVSDRHQPTAECISKDLPVETGPCSPRWTKTTSDAASSDAWLEKSCS